MEPSAILSVICNVFQLIEQAIGAAKICKEIYDRGSLDENDKIEKYAEDITALNKDLVLVLNNNNNNPTTLPPPAKKLQQLANDVSKTAVKLKKELSQLKLKKNQGIRAKGSALSMMLKSLKKRGTIDKLRAELKRQDAALQSCLVQDLHIKADQDVMFLQKEFAALSQGQKDTITRLLGHIQQASTDVKASVTAAETNIMSSITTAQANITAQLNSQQYAHTKYTQDHDSNALRKRVLDRLAFPEMYDRRKMIDNHVGEFRNTYHWIFYPPPRTDSHQQHEFVAWLREGRGIFWFSGKPGSGKSSLMAYIYQNLHTGQVGFDHLNVWAQPQSVRLLSFWFFRPASCVFQKSLEGFWRSLCFQILEADETLVETIRNNNNGSAPETLKSFFGQVRPHSESCTNAELKAWFIYLVTHSHIVKNSLISQPLTGLKM
ncbi:hypothetical protein FOPE_01349 [Fonsecaea pedrosoi]|nr:hypothetical protein FOPE_01349 [Fonsecaea pedrosoi]